jgi:hypothetical protein
MNGTSASHHQTKDWDIGWWLPRLAQSNQDREPKMRVEAADPKFGDAAWPPFSSVIHLRYRHPISLDVILSNPHLSRRSRDDYRQPLLMRNLRQHKFIHA